MSDQKTVNQQDSQTLKLVEGFGFKFFGYDEANNTLVVAPNGQIVLLSIAYNFVKLQMSKSTGNQPDGSIESMPNLLPQIPSIPTGIDNNIERGLEKGIENKIEKRGELQENNLQIQLPAKSVKAPLTFQHPESPYGDSPKLSFHPTDLVKTQGFIAQNSKASKRTTARWLAEQFKKFLEEQKLAA